MPNSHYGAPPSPGDDMPYQQPVITAEELNELKYKLTRAEERADRLETEVKGLRDWRHEVVQKPQADLLKVGLMEQEVKGLLTGMTENTRLTQRVLAVLNGDDDKPGIRGRLDRVELAISSWVTLINGDGGKPGMNGRLDALERSWSNLSRLVWIVIGAVIVGLARIFWSSIPGKG